MKKWHHKFIDLIPDDLENETLYISIKYNTLSHLCACGCGNEVSVPISPNDWNMTYNGKTVSLYPSIGNWSLPCQSHYWIKDSDIVWSETWSRDRIVANRSADKLLRRSEKKSFWDFLKIK